MENIVHICDAAYLNEPIRTDELNNSIARVNSNRAAGLDRICIEMFNVTYAILPFLTQLFNHIYETGHFPNTCSNIILLPLHEKGNINKPNNDRGISLINSSWKVFINVLTNMLST